MSLEDELTAAVLVRPRVTEAWLEEWVASLSPADKKAWHAWLSDFSVPAAPLFRVIRQHGYPHSLSAWRYWLRNYRESLG